MKNALYSILIILSINGCGTEIIHSYNFERDGEPYSVAIDQLSALEKDRLRYDIDEYSSENNVTYLKSSERINSDDYNFYIIIPIKIKTTELSLDHKISIKSKVYARNVIPSDIKNLTKDNDGYYHAKIYIDARYFASVYYLNDVQNWSAIMNQVDPVVFGDHNSYVSNTITINASEIEAVLDKLALPHDRLSFQPDAF